MSWGGKQAVFRDSTVLPDSVGDSTAKMYFIPGQGSGEWIDGPKWVDGPCPGAVEKDMLLKSGDKISHVFGPDDPPPWYELDAPRFSRPRTDAEVVVETKRRKKARAQFLAKKQLTDPLATLTPQEEERFQTRDTSKYPHIPGLFACFLAGLPLCVQLISVCYQVTLVLPKGQNRWYGKGASGDLVSRYHVAKRSSRKCLISDSKRASLPTCGSSEAMDSSSV